MILFMGGLFFLSTEIIYGETYDRGSFEFIA